MDHTLSLPDQDETTRSGSSLAAAVLAPEPGFFEESKRQDQALGRDDGCMPVIKNPPVGLIHLDSFSGQSASDAGDSFAVCNSDQAIERIVIADDRSVQEFLGEGRPAEEIAKLAGEGIRREGFRCLQGSFEAEQGEALCQELIECHTIESVLRICAIIYTRDTFLYRRVNKFLRSGTESDGDTGRNLGLYIGLLRECFCICGRLSPVSWECPQVVYRGAHFSIDIVADYARRPDELIRWQGFTSSSGDRGVALSFLGTVLFEISLANPVPSLHAMSAFKNEQEFILSPYQRFSLSAVRWDCDCGRWIIAVAEEQDLPDVRSWFAEDATP
jgi:hypothetical protein